MGTLGFLLPFRKGVLDAFHYYLGFELAFQTLTISLEHLKVCLRPKPPSCTV